MRILTMANMLTVLRLASLPLIIWLLRSQRYYPASAVFITAMLTDAVDGWLAVRLNQRSRLGLYLDPVTDKILILSLLYELAFSGLLHPAVPHLFLARELLQNGVRAVTASQGKVVGANWMGKTKAFLQSVLITVGLALPALAGSKLYVEILAVFRVSAGCVLVLAWIFFATFLYRNRKILSK